jgi:uracil-DNA glycosylase
MGNLFDGNNARLREVFKASLNTWVKDFSYDTLQRLETTLAMVNEDRQHCIVYPTKYDVLRIYREIPLKSIKVVILGQDPYHDGNANGFAFGCKNTLSPSLKQILDALNHYFKADKTFKKDIDLEYLVKQNVFLLNTVLTVRFGQPLSHNRVGWQSFTKDTVKLINEKRDNIVWLLWGSKAKSYKEIITNPTHKIITDEHPVSAEYDKERWLSPSFLDCNTFLNENNLGEIKWL